MGKLTALSLSVGSNNIAAKIFEELHPNFLEVKYKRPSDYVSFFWSKYQEHSTNNGINVNGKIFEYILATLFIREGLLPLYVSAKVAFVPNVIYDMMFYTDERGPICISAKTSLRERYKQADLEAIALKYVHRKALAYLITLNTVEAAGVKAKIKSGHVIGLDDVIVATSADFDKLIVELKEFNISEPPTVKVLNSNQVVTKAKVDAIR